MQSSQIEITSEEKEFLETVASVFTIEQEEYALCLAITTPQINFSACNSSLVLFVNSDNKKVYENAHHLNHGEIDGQMVFIYLKRAQVIFLRYNGQDRLTVNG